MPLSSDTRQKCNTAKNANNAAAPALRTDAATEVDPNRQAKMLDAAAKCEAASAALVNVLVDDV